MQPDLTFITQFLEFNSTNLVPNLAVITLIIFGITWLGVSVWTWKDISKRSQNPLVVLLSFILVLVGNFPGLIIYLLLRPEHTKDEQQSMQLFHASVLDENILGCPECGTLVRKDYKFCPDCKSDLVRCCNKCEMRINFDWTYCVYCGETLIEETKFEKFVERFRKVRLTSLPKLIFNLPTYALQLREPLGRIFSHIFNLPTYITKAIANAWNKYVDLVTIALKQPKTSS